jgi:hypothetical protein
MKTKLLEVYTMDNIGKNTKFFAKDSEYLNKPVVKIPGIKHHSTMDDGRELYHARDKFENDHYYAVDPKSKKVNAAVSMNHNKYISKEHLIGAAVSTGKANIQHIYHHLITKHNFIITSDHQSEGGKHIWTKLSKMKGVHVHAFDPKTKKPYNVDLENDHPAETHVSDKDLESGYEKDEAKKVMRTKLVAHKKIEENTTQLIKRALSNKSLY